MQERIHREFIVDLPVKLAWQHLARVEQWPSWAKHIKRVQLIPPGELTADSSGAFHLTNGVQSTFHVTEFNPYHNWCWVGPFLWLRISYDHRFAAVDQEQSKLIWTVSASGFGEFLFGRLFAGIYTMNLNRAIPNLVAEMKAKHKSPKL